MRVWDIPVSQLCNKHLIAQHHEIHCIYSIIVNNKKGFAHHPEVMRWRGHLAALEAVHGDTFVEMRFRGIRHNHIAESVDAGRIWETNRIVLPKPWQSIETQRQILLSKNCGCLSNE